MRPRSALDWSLAAVALAAPLSIAGLNAALAALTASALWVWAVEPAQRAALAAPLRSPVFKLLAAGAAWALVCSCAGLDPARSLRVMPKDLHKLWSFAVLGAGLAVARREKAASALAAGLGVAALVGAAQTAALSGGDAGFVRARAFLHPVVYGEIVGLGLLGAAAVLGSNRASRRLAASACALLAIALALNQTRAVLLALLAAAGAVAVAAPRARRLALAGLAGLILLAGVWEVMPTGGRNLRTLLGSSPDIAGSHHARFQLWHAALGMARERPLTGMGPGNFRRAYEERFDTSVLDKERVWGSAHNLFLHQLAERGAPGLLLLLALFAGFIGAARRALAERGDAAALWSYAAAVAFLVMNLTETAWQTEQAATFFLLAWLWGAGPRPRGEVL